MKRALLALGLVLLAGLGAGAWLARAEGGRLPPAVSVGGVDVGGRRLSDAAALLRREAERLSRRRIAIVWDGGVAMTSGAALGATPEIRDALEEAGRTRGAFSRLAARLGVAGTRSVRLHFRLDPAALAAVLERTEARAGRPAASARVEVGEHGLAVTPSRVGLEVDRVALAEALEALPVRVRLPLRRAVPAVREPAAHAARERAERLLEQPPAAVHKTARLDLGEKLVRAALRFEERGRALEVSLDPTVLERPLRRAFRRYERRPRDAAFRIAGKRVLVVPARSGRRLDIEGTSKALAAGEPQVGARFEPIAPKVATRQLESLRIKELVSEFATPYPCCAPRVRNIQLAARILDGWIIGPGGRFSLNQALGERTAERGFVRAPMIAAGRLVDAVGGGVSQVATTFYNAAFFAGLELIESTPHEFYISRYPMGREATVSWGGPELVFRNDWPAAILVEVLAADTSITVRFYSSKLGRRVETRTGPPHSYRAARVRKIVNRALRPGKQRYVQRGGIPGFTVTYTRRVYRGKKLTRDEKTTVRYRPEETIIEIGPPKKKAKKKPAGGKGPGSAAGTTPADRPPG